MKKVNSIIIGILILGPIIMTILGNENIIVGIGVNLTLGIILYNPLIMLLVPKPELENEDDYAVEFWTDKVLIRYKDREFWTEIKNIKTDSNLILKDQNGKVASKTLTFQIINDIKERYKYLIKERIIGMAELSENEVISKFKGIRHANEYEKSKYLKYIQKKDNKLFRNLNIFRYFLIILVILSIVLDKSFFKFICILGGVIIIEWIRMAFRKHNENIIHKCINGNLYIANCYAYEVIKRKSGRHNNIITYYIKITDNIGGYLEKEFEVDYQSVNINSDTQAQLYLIEYEGGYDIDVCTERMIELEEID